MLGLLIQLYPLLILSSLLIIHYIVEKQLKWSTYRLLWINMITISIHIITLVGLIHWSRY